MPERVRRKRERNEKNPRVESEKKVFSEQLFHRKHFKGKITVH